MIKYCNLCKRQVNATKKFSWVWFLIWALCFGVGAIVYLIYFLLKPNNKCPICGNKI